MWCSSNRCTDCETNSFLGHSTASSLNRCEVIRCIWVSVEFLCIAEDVYIRNIRMEMFILLFRLMLMLCHTCFGCRCLFLFFICAASLFSLLPSLHCRRRKILLSAAIASGTRSVIGICDGNRKTWCSLNANISMKSTEFGILTGFYRFVVKYMFTVLFGSVCFGYITWLEKKFRRRKKCIMLNYKFSPLIMCVTPTEPQIKTQNTP